MQRTARSPAVTRRAGARRVRRANGNIIAVPGTASRAPAPLATSYQFWRAFRLPIDFGQLDVLFVRYIRPELIGRWHGQPKLIGSEALTDEVDMQASG